MKKKTGTSTQAPLDKMDKTIDPEKFTFSLPASTSNRSSSGTSSNAKSKLLALSVYILNTTDDFKDLTYRVTKNTDSEESLVITHGRNLGLLGENLDPVTLTLTEKGACSLNVLFRPAEKFHLLEKTLFDAGQFVSILKRLTTKDEYIFCPGIDDVQPACFVKKLMSHTHPFDRQQSVDCTVWYKNTEGIKDQLVARCKPCRDLSKHLLTLPKKVTPQPKNQQNEKEKTEETPRRSKRGRKRKESTNTNSEAPEETNKNNSNAEIVKPNTEDESQSLETPVKYEKPQSPRSSKRISEKGVSFCKHCVCFHSEKDKKCIAPTTVQSETGLDEEEISDTDMASEDLTKSKSTRGKRKGKTPVKRKSTDENVPIENEDSVECDLVIDAVHVAEMDVGAHEELEFVVKQESDEEQEEDEVPEQPETKKRRKSGRNKSKKSKPDEANESLDELDAGASALLALNRGRKRPESTSQSAKKPGRPRVLGNQHSAPSGIEALLTAAMTADKDDKGGNKSGKKLDNHLPTPRSKRDQLNTPFKLLMAQIESDKNSDGDGSKTWKCPECGDHYSSKANLRRHLRIHDLYRPYFCPVCDKTFVQKITLKVHMRLHSGDKPHTCSICNRSFAQKSNMETHLRRHLGQRPYKCNLCNKGFSDKGSLGEHAKTHTGEQPYVCPICKKAFSQRANMRTHMRRHKDDRPYACGKCNKMFKNKDGYWKHITAVHKDTTLKSDIPNLQTMEYYYKHAVDKDSSGTEDQTEDFQEEVEIEEIAEEDHEEVLMLIGDKESESKEESVVVVENEVETKAVTQEETIEETTTQPKAAIKTVQEETTTAEAEAATTTAETEAATSSITEVDGDVSAQTAETSTPETSSTKSAGTCYSALLNSLKSKVSQQIQVKEGSRIMSPQLPGGTSIAFIRNGNQISFVRPSSMGTLPVINASNKAVGVGKPADRTTSTPVSVVSSNITGTKILINPTVTPIKSEPGVFPVSLMKSAVINPSVQLSANSNVASPVLINRVIPSSGNVSTFVKTSPLVNKPSPVIQTERITVCKSSPPEGYISVNLVGSDGRPMGSRYMNPKDLGLTVSIEKSNVTKCQLSSILSDNKNIVTSTIVTDPYSGKAVTFKPKGSVSPATQISPGISTSVTSPLTNIKIAPKTVFSPPSSSPLQKTVLLTSTDNSPSQRTVVLDMSSKQFTSPSVIPISIPVTSFSQNRTYSKATTARAPVIKSPVKTSLKSLVNASTLKSVAEKCKASAAQSPMVKTLLKSPPLSNAEITHLEELKSFQINPDTSSEAVAVKVQVESADEMPSQSPNVSIKSTSENKTSFDTTNDTSKSVSDKTFYVIKKSNLETLVKKETSSTTENTATTQNNPISSASNTGLKSEENESIQVMVDGKMETVTIPLA